MTEGPDPRTAQSPGSGESYAAKTVRNVAWLGGSQFLRQAVAMAATVVLARLLAPDDYGIFAMTLFVNEMAQLFVNFGIGAALVQRKEVDQRLLSTCFWANLVIAAVAGLVVVASAPFAADYFNQAMVGHLLVVSAINIGIGALLVVPQSLLSRALAFKQVALGGTFGSLFGAAAAVVMALLGAGVWALVFQPLIGTLINLIYVASRARWLPDLTFDPASIQGVWRFSVNLLIDNIAAHVTRNLQQIIIAPLAGAAAMGLLAMATLAAWLPVAQFTQAAVRAVYPVFSRLQDDHDRFHGGLMRTASLVAMLAFPVLVGLAVLAADVMPVAFGPQWAPAAPLVSILCALCVVHSVAGIAGSAMLAQGRSGTTMRISMLGLLVVGAALWAVRGMDIQRVTTAIALSHGAMALLTLHLVLRRIPTGWRMLLRALWRPGLAAAGMGLVLIQLQTTMQELTSVTRLLVLIPAGAALYGVLTLVFNRNGLLDLRGLLFKRGF